ncbi:MAG: hypothetical protein WBV39_15410 [Rudaea sp.]
MRKFALVAISLLLLCFAIDGLARDAIDNGQLQVKPYQQDLFETGAYRMGKAELFGYVGELIDNKHITGVVLRNGDHASAVQKHIIAEIAQAQHLNALIELDGKLQPLVDPTPAPPGEAAAPGQAARQAQHAQPARPAPAPADGANSH